MFLIEGQVQPYAWGSPSSIPAILGTTATGEPQAEYWLGAHAKAPSVILDGSDSPNLLELVNATPEVVGERSRGQFGDRLPYLLKILAAAQPLSLQAHPSRAQAQEGFRLENEAGVPIDASTRTYRDDWPKPEMLVALTEIDALCGFRDPKRTAGLFDGLNLKIDLSSVIGPLTERAGGAGLAEVFLDVLSLDESRRHYVVELVAAAVAHVNDPGELGLFARTAVELDEHYPGDPSILAALLMNRVTLQPGEAIFLPAGNMHAYLNGTGVEIMANSDNVLRGGLTPKHIDVDALVQVVNFEAEDVEIIRPTPEGAGVSRYITPAPEFALWRLDLDASMPAILPGQESGRIILVTDGYAACATSEGTVELVKGKSAFVPAGEQVQMDGNCTAFVAAPGV